MWENKTITFLLPQLTNASVKAFLNTQRNSAYGRLMVYYKKGLIHLKSLVIYNYLKQSKIT